MEKTTKLLLRKIKVKSNLFLHSLHKEQLQVSGLGFHILSIEDFGQKLLSRNCLHNTLYTHEELSYCNNRLQSLAGRFAAKAAARKALQKKIPWTEMNIPSSSTRQPRMSFLDGSANISISITHDEDLAAAFAACPAGALASENIHNAQIGLDIAYTSRINKLISKQSESLLKRIFTVEERDEAKKDVQKMTEKWSGKEAVSKALGTGIGVGEMLQNIEILTRSNKPFVRLSGSLLKLAEERNLLDWKISFMRFPEMTFAFVIASV